MRPEDQQLIQLALESRLLTRRQADLIAQEVQSQPGLDAGQAMLDHHFLTNDQLSELMEVLAGGGPPSDVTSAPRLSSSAGQPAAIQSPTQLKVGAPEKPREEVQIPRSLSGLLKLARHWGASDLHLSVGRPPFVRLHGQLRYMETEPLTPERAEELNFSPLTEEQQERARKESQLDFAIQVDSGGRYRCNIFRQRLGWDGAYRIISAGIPTFQDLGLPETLRVYTEYSQGLVMVTGPGGSGKTTTVAAMLDMVNSHRHDHIITVEDPVEYILPAKCCQVTQREVGHHTKSFAAALRAALREDPDIIFIGELRDLETTSIAISAAETGHLVFGTLHTGSAVRTVARIVEVYPVSQQAQVCTMVAESLRGVISQRLVPRRDGRGRALALEVMMGTSGVAQQIKEGKTHLLQSLIQSGKKQGMMLLEDFLLALHQQGQISGRMAWQQANNKQPFEAIKNQD